MNELYKDKTITVTGGTGSFGGQFVRHLLSTNVKEIRVISRDEAKQDSMRHDVQDDRVKFFLGDVRDRASLRSSFVGADYILHAAALKQVPACEIFPEQAFKTNVEGSKNVIDEAIEKGVERVICISTDKSVYPINAMGMTKALMEKLVQASSTQHRGRTNVSCVRYGNVVSSRGSVVPVFAEKIRLKRPLTITVPHMTRFLLTLENAVDLIEFALAAAQPGDIFIRKSPAATVSVLADAMKAIYRSDAQIEIIGIRPGEKIHETLCTFAELARAEEFEKFYRIPMHRANTDHKFDQKSHDKDYTSDITEILDCQSVERLLLSINSIAADVRVARTYEQDR